MPIVAILNGYYRSGTTILWWIFRLSNLDSIVLYEPTSPVLLDFLNRWRYGKIDDLHKLPIFDGYFMLPDDILSKFKRNHRGRSVYTDAKDAIITLNPLHECNDNIIIKTCQLHLILNEVSNYYNCNYVHIIRNPAEVFVSHLGAKYRNIGTLNKMLNVQIEDKAIDGAFWLNELYTIASKRLNVTVKPNDYIGKFIISWIYYNYEAVKQIEKSDKGLAILFDKIVTSPRKCLKRIAEHLDIKIDTAYSCILKRNKAFTLPDEFTVEFENRIEGLNLLEKYMDIIEWGLVV